MAQSGFDPNPIKRPPIGNIVWGIVLNAVFPVNLYKLSKRYYSPSEFTALVVAALFPIGKSGFELIYHRQVDPISILVLLGIGTDSVALLVGGTPRLLLVRESLITGVFGLACFFSLLLPRPMMFISHTISLAEQIPCGKHDSMLHGSSRRCAFVNG